jgi:hypothetical protein
VSVYVLVRGRLRAAGSLETSEGIPVIKPTTELTTWDRGELETGRVLIAAAAADVTE